jgi:large repetitive protein
MTVANSRTGAWSYDNTANVVPDGTHSVTVRSMDRAGNLSQVSRAFALTVDTTPAAPPVITTLSPDTGRSATDWITNNNQKPTISGTTIPSGTVQVFCNGILLGQTTARGNNGQWSFTDPSNYKDGSYAYTATVTDYVGNVSALSVPQTMVVDTKAPAAPAITGFSPDTGVVGDGVTNVRNPTFFGTAEPGSTVVICQSGQNGSLGSVLADANGNYGLLSALLTFTV